MTPLTPFDGLMSWFAQVWPFLGPLVAYWLLVARIYALERRVAELDKNCQNVADFSLEVNKGLGASISLFSKRLSLIERLDTLESKIQPVISFSEAIDRGYVPLHDSCPSCGGPTNNPDVALVQNAQGCTTRMPMFSCRYCGRSLALDTNRYDRLASEYDKRGRTDFPVEPCFVNAMSNTPDLEATWRYSYPP